MQQVAVASGAGGGDEGAREVDVAELRYYKNTRGEIVGVTPGREDGEYTWLPNRVLRFTWIRTADLYTTREEAKSAAPARWLTQSRGW